MSCVSEVWTLDNFKENSRHVNSHSDRSLVLYLKGLKWSEGSTGSWGKWFILNVMLAATYIVETGNNSK